MSDEDVDDNLVESHSDSHQATPEPSEKSDFGLGSIADGESDPIIDESVDDWLQGISFETTDDVPIPDRLVDQVIGQEDAALVIRKAAEQRRHMLMIGDPGTG
ncbi:MAG: ATP-dependent protease LonB, partial [Candidatus Thermoplasmatota archaeon]|nr:ATP-dependent protease LonB [Candidatus Thermoplasmatota archaeon]